MHIFTEQIMLKWFYARLLNMHQWSRSNKFLFLLQSRVYLDFKFYICYFGAWQVMHEACKRRRLFCLYTQRDWQTKHNASWHCVEHRQFPILWAPHSRNNEDDDRKWNLSGCFHTTNNVRLLSSCLQQARGLREFSDTPPNCILTILVSWVSSNLTNWASSWIGCKRNFLRGFRKPRKPNLLFRISKENA